MSDTAQRNIVNLEDYGQQRRGLGSGAATQALRGIRELAATKLSQNLGHVMEKIDDALFARAEKAENNMAQTQYFDAMRELRIIRKDIEEDFAARFQNQFNQGVPRAGQFSEGFSLNWDDDNSGLGLVDKNDMEEDLAIANMVSKTRSNCKQSLYSLDKRIGFLINDPDLERWVNPLGPEAICGAFHEATRLVETGLEIRLVIFKLFDQHVISNMDELYKEVNQYLVRMGVLPEIKTTVRKNGTPMNGPQSPAAGPLSDQSGIATDPAAGTGYAPEGTGYVPAGSGYAPGGTAHAPGPAGGSGAAGNGVPAGGGYVTGPASIHALTFLQQGGTAPEGQYAGGTELSVNPADLASGQVNILHGMKDSTLIQDLGKTGDMTIDIVAMLFDYILDDKNIPDAMRALIGRLQIPLLKVALLDREFFSRKSHPARQLLNRLAAAAVGWDEQLGNKDPLYLKVQSIVQTILDEFEDDTAIFQTLLDELEFTLRKYEEQAEIRAERSAKVMEGQERLEVAKSSTMEEIEPHLNDDQNLEFVREFVTTHWKNLLFITCARQGKDSEAWQGAVKTMDKLIWSIKPKYTREDRQQLVAMQPGLLNDIRAGMQRLSIPVSERDDFIAKLVRAHGRTAVKQDPAAAETPVPKDAAPKAEAETGEAETQTQAARPAARQEETPPAADTDDHKTAADDRYIASARQLTAGTWLEFTGSDGKTARAKLSWISPITNTYLFTDRQGLKAGNYDLEELAGLLQCARARILNDAPLMDRAVSTVLKEYQKH